MYAVVITDEGGVRRRLDFSKSELTVGRVQGNDIVLAKRNVSKQHARLTMKEEQAVVVDLGSTNGTWVNGRKITSPHPLKKGDKIYIADFILTARAGERWCEPIGGAFPRRAFSEPPPLPSGNPPRRLPPPGRSAPRCIGREIVDFRSLDARVPRSGDIRGTSLPPNVEDRATDAPQAPPKAEPGPVGDPLAVLLAASRGSHRHRHCGPRRNEGSGALVGCTRRDCGDVPRNANRGVGGCERRHASRSHTSRSTRRSASARSTTLISDDSVRGIIVSGPGHIFADQGCRDSKHRTSHLLVTRGSVSNRSATSHLAVVVKCSASAESSTGAYPFGPRVTILQAPLVAQELVVELRMSAFAIPRTSSPKPAG